MARQYYNITEMCELLQKLLKALKFSFSAEGKNSNLKLMDYTPSEGEIFKELEPILTEMIATAELTKRIGPVIITRKADDEKTYNFKVDFALGTTFFFKEDLIKSEQGTLLEGFKGLVSSINDIEIDDETLEREELIEEAERIGVIWTKPLDEYELYEIREAIANRRLARMNQPCPYAENLGIDCRCENPGNLEKCMHATELELEEERIKEEDRDEGGEE